MNNKQRNHKKNMEILADLILRLQIKKRSQIERISIDLWKRNKRARYAIYLGIFNKKEIELLISAYKTLLCSMEGQPAQLNVILDFDYRSLIELEQLMALLYEGEMILPVSKNMMDKHGLSVIWLDQLCSEQNLAAVVRERLNAILDKSLSSLQKSMKYQVLKRSYDQGGYYEQVSG